MPHLYPIPKVVECELLVCAICHITGIRFVTDIWRRVVFRYRCDGEPEQLVKRRHQLRVATREVIIDRDYVHRDAGHRGGARGQRRGQRLALPGLHLREHAVEHDPAAEHLAVVMPHLQAAAGQLTHECKRLHHEFVDEAATHQRLAKTLRPAGQFAARQIAQHLAGLVDLGKKPPSIQATRLDPMAEPHHGPVRELVETDDALRRALRIRAQALTRPQYFATHRTASIAADASGGTPAGRTARSRDRNARTRARRCVAPRPVFRVQYERRCRGS